MKVEDEGRGIPPERLNAIFEPFQQSEAADQHRGTGLGLTISRQLARLMGGDVTVQSEARRRVQLYVVAADRAVRPRPALKAGGMWYSERTLAMRRRKSLDTVAAAAAISATIVMRSAPGASVYPAVRETIWT